jgi:microfibrillar-associated protein 1
MNFIIIMRLTHLQFSLFKAVCWRRLNSLSKSQPIVIGAYPKLMKFYDRLGVALKIHDYSYSFSTKGPNDPTPRDSSVKAHMIYNGASGRAGVGVPSTVYAARSSRSPNILNVFLSFILWICTTLVYVIHYSRLLFLSRPSSRTPTVLCRETLRAWTERTAQQNFISRMLGWEGFVADVILPLFSAVCTTSIEEVWEHPAAEILGKLC